MKAGQNALMALAISTALAGSAVGAAGVADFYANKQLILMANFAPGGPTDVEARFLAKHLPKYLKGSPKIIVQNRGGGGGTVGLNWLGEVAKPDGLTLGYLSGIVSRAAIEDSTIRVDMRKFEFISAGPPGTMVAFARTDIIPGGLKDPFDIMKAKDFWSAGISPDTNKDIRNRMQLDMLGLKYNFVTGYPGTADIRLALQRGEVQFMTESISSYRQTIEPSMTKRGTVVPLWADPLDDGTGELAPSHDTTELGFLPYHEFYRKVKGTLPSGEMWEALRVQNQVGAFFLRVLLMPPGTPRRQWPRFAKRSTSCRRTPRCAKSPR